MMLQVYNILGKGLYWSAKLVATVSRRHAKVARNPRVYGSALGIEAGERGWNQIMFAELFQSAQEFFGPADVEPLVVDTRKSYVKQVARFVEQHPIKHYLYDPRTGSQSLVSGLIDSFRLLRIFSQRGIEPIVLCTDISLRRWRFQAAVVTAAAGVCLTDLEPHLVRKIFPHDRLIGPILLPISSRTMSHLKRERRPHKPGQNPSVSFFGLLYEPRTSQLEEIQRGLAALGINFVINGRNFSGDKVSNEEYWGQLLSADIVVSPSSQFLSKDIDLGHVNHLIYRFSEALACGACLVIEAAPGAERYFMDGRDLILWEDPADAIAKIALLVGNPEKIFRVSKSGRKRLQDLVERKYFWAEISEFLKHPA